MAHELLSRITSDPNICHGKPVVRGMRWPVQNVLELMASGMTNDEIRQDHPELEAEDLLACLAYAARVTEVKSIHRLAP
jgi:uncharacterized protein (DUF433 family)